MAGAKGDQGAGDQPAHAVTDHHQAVPGNRVIAEFIEFFQHFGQAVGGDIDTVKTGVIKRQRGKPVAGELRHQRRHATGIGGEPMNEQGRLTTIEVGGNCPRPIAHAQDLVPPPYQPALRFGDGWHGSDHFHR